MASKLTLALLLMATLSYGQLDYRIITLDSIISTGAAQGVYGLTAETYGGNIHLTYVYGDTEESWYLMYEVRNNGEQLSKEVVYQFSDGVWVSPETAIQFDAPGNPHIYLGGVSAGKGFMLIAHRTNGSWQIDPFSFGNRAYVSASKDGSEYLGFATKGDQNPFPVRYFGEEDGAWAEYSFTVGGHYTSEPAAFTKGKDEYMGFLEFHDPDTTVLYIYKRSDQGPWELDYKEEIIPATWVDFDARWCMFGAHGETIHFIHTTKGLITHMTKVDGAWQIMSSGHLETYGNERNNCNILDFDEEGNFYTVFFYDKVWWMNSNEESFTFEPALDGVFYEHYDLAILDGQIYLYAIAGNKDFPFGDPLMFYEAIGTLETLTDLEDLPTMQIAEARVIPNPASQNLRLEINCEQSQDLVINWLDVQGRQLTGDRKFSCPKGLTTIDLSGHSFQPGLYYIHISNERGQLTVPVVLR